MVQSRRHPACITRRTRCSSPRTLRLTREVTGAPINRPDDRSVPSVNTTEPDDPGRARRVAAVLAPAPAAPCLYALEYARLRKSSRSPRAAFASHGRRHPVPGGRCTWARARCSLSYSPCRSCGTRVLLPSRLARLHGWKAPHRRRCAEPAPKFGLRYVEGDDPPASTFAAPNCSSPVAPRTRPSCRDRVDRPGRLLPLLCWEPPVAMVDSIAARPAFCHRDGSAPAALADHAGDKVSGHWTPPRVRARVSGVRGSSRSRTPLRIFRRARRHRLDRGRGSRQTVRHPPSSCRVRKSRPPTEFTDAVARLAERHTVLVASARRAERARSGRSDASFPCALPRSPNTPARPGGSGACVAGALTLQASADLLPARTADRYIDLKKSGRL